MRLVFLCITFVSTIGFCYILPPKVILQKVAENTGNGIYSIEQEVQINAGAEPIFLKEQWVVENERTLKLTVTGVKELKDSLRLEFIYVGGQKWLINNGKKTAGKIPDEFVERYFHVRNPENLLSYLQNLKVLPSPMPARTVIGKKGADVKYEADPFLRLGRIDGTVSFAFGTPTPSEQKEPNPGLWVDQDSFNVKKLRFPSGAEVLAENYSVFARGLNFPKMRTLQWGTSTAYIRVTSVSGKAPAGQNFQPNAMETQNTFKNLSSPMVLNLVEEFYSRFR